MPYLIIAALAALGYWGYTRTRPGMALLPGNGSRPAATPEQIVIAEAPSLQREILDLLRNGRNPVAMHAAAGELEKYGFFDAAMLLHKRADELTSIATLAAQAEATRIEAERARIEAERARLVAEQVAEYARQEAERVRQETADRQAAIKAVEDEERAAAARYKAAQDAAAAAAAAEAGLRARVPAAAAGTTGSVTLEGLKVYQDPSFLAPSTAQLPLRANVTINNSTDQFYLVQYQEPPAEFFGAPTPPLVTGWVDKRYVTLGGGSFAPVRRGSLT